MLERTLADHEYPTLRHPTRYVWDFWYWHDPADHLFHVFYLSAEPDLVPEQQHHFHSTVGYATTRDFTAMEWKADDVLCANAEGWDNTSIWTGDVVRVSGGFLMLYTSRDSTVDDGLTQNIGAAYTRNLTAGWRRLKLRIAPEAPYELRTQEGDTSIHAWRDPFLFKTDEDAYMVVAAKLRSLPSGRKGAIGLLRSRDPDLATWQVLAPVVAPGWYSEMEVPQIYLDSAGGYRLVYSTWAKGDHSSQSERRGGFQSISLSVPLQATSPVTTREVLLDEASGLYACRIVPEMGGEIVGFDVRSGGIRRSGVKTGYRHLNRDFSHHSIAEAG